MANRVQVKVNADGLPVVATGGDRESVQNPGRAPSFTEKLFKAKLAQNQLRRSELEAGREEQAAAETGAETWAGMERERGAGNTTTEEMIQIERDLKDRLKPGQSTTFNWKGKRYHIANNPRKGFQYGEGAAPLHYANPSPQWTQEPDLEYEHVPYWE